MRCLLAAAVIAAAPNLAWAQSDDANLPAGYAEIAVGASFIPTISTNTYTLSVGSTTGTGKANLNYDTGLTAGGEIGVAGVGAPEIRLAVSYDYLGANFANGSVVGTVNGVSGSLPFTRSDVQSLGIDLDNDVHVVTGNVYYSLPLVGKVRPYLGLGLGAAMMSHTDTQLAFTGTAGVRAALSDAVYVGLRYRFYHIEGPTDDFGLKYDAITNHSVMALIGFYMN